MIFVGLLGFLFDFVIKAYKYTFSPNICRELQIVYNEYGPIDSTEHLSENIINLLKENEENFEKQSQRNYEEQEKKSSSFKYYDDMRIINFQSISENVSRRFSNI